MIEHSKGVVLGFDQDLWALLGAYGAWSATEALELFRLLREANLRMLGILSTEQWERTGNYVERGRLTVRELARHMAMHDINHIRRIEKLLADSNWRPGPSAATMSLNLDDVAAFLQNTIILLRRSAAALPDRACSWHPDSGKWCAKEIIGHLTEEDKRDFVGRIRMMLENPEPVIKVNDQDAVARTRRDCEKTLRDLLDEFESVRTDSVTFVKKLKPEDLDCGGIHPKIGHITVRELLHEWVYHDLNHVSQINANFQGLLLNHLGGMQQFYKS